MFAVTVQTATASAPSAKSSVTSANARYASVTRHSDDYVINSNSNSSNSSSNLPIPMISTQPCRHQCRHNVSKAFIILYLVAYTT